MHVEWAIFLKTGELRTIQRIQFRDNKMISERATHILQRFSDGGPQSLGILRGFEVEAILPGARHHGTAHAGPHGANEVIVVESDYRSRRRDDGFFRIIEPVRGVRGNALERSRDGGQRREPDADFAVGHVNAHGAALDEVVKEGIGHADGLRHAAVLDGADGGRSQHGSEDLYDKDNVCKIIINKCDVR